MQDAPFAASMLCSRTSWNKNKCVRTRGAAGRYFTSGGPVSSTPGCAHSGTELRELYLETTATIRLWIPALLSGGHSGRGAPDTRVGREPRARPAARHGVAS